MKTCSKCGETKEDSEYRLTRSGKSLRSSCTICLLKTKALEVKRYRLRNPVRRKSLRSKEVRKAQKKRYETKHPEKVKESRKRCCINARKRNPKKSKEEKAKARNKVTAGYARELLVRQLKMPITDIPQALVELKREQLLTRRVVKQLNKLIGEKNGK